MVTRYDANFTAELVTAVEVDFEAMIGDGLLKAGLTLDQNVRPLCEQPTGAQPSPCIQLPNTPAVCSRDILESAWIESLGYTFAIQV